MPLSLACPSKLNRRAESLASRTVSHLDSTFRSIEYIYEKDIFTDDMEWITMSQKNKSIAINVD